jgi:hypothetical protein
MSGVRLKADDTDCVYNSGGDVTEVSVRRS